MSILLRSLERDTEYDRRASECLAAARLSMVPSVQCRHTEAQSPQTGHILRRESWTGSFESTKRKFPPIWESGTVARRSPHETIGALVLARRPSVALKTVLVPTEKRSGEIPF